MDVRRRLMLSTASFGLSLALVAATGRPAEARAKLSCGLCEEDEMFHAFFQGGGAWYSCDSGFCHSGIAGGYCHSYHADCDDS